MTTYTCVVKLGLFFLGHHRRQSSQEVRSPGSEQGTARFQRRAPVGSRSGLGLLSYPVRRFLLLFLQLFQFSSANIL